MQITSIVVWATISVLGIVAACLGNPGHLLFSALPGAVLAIASWLEYRYEKRRKDVLKRKIG